MNVRMKCIGAIKRESRVDRVNLILDQLHPGINLMDGDGVAVIEAAIAARIEGNATGRIAVKHHGYLRNRHALDRAQHPVADTEVFIVAAKDNPVTF